MYRYIEALLMPAKDLADAIVQIKDRKLAKEFLKDLLTPQEREEMEARIKLVKMLCKGTPQRKIAEKLKISLCKITRGSREVKYGTGAFKKLLS